MSPTIKGFFRRVRSTFLFICTTTSNLNNFKPQQLQAQKRVKNEKKKQNRRPEPRKHSKDPPIAPLFFGTMTFWNVLDCTRGPLHLFQYFAIQWMSKNLKGSPFYIFRHCDTVCVDDSLYSDHFAVFAWFSLPKPLSNQSSQTTSKYSASSFSAHCFNQNLSSHYYDLLSFPNSSFLQFSFDDYVAFWYQVLMNAINESCHRKTNRRLEFPYFYSSHSIHMIIKLRTAAKNNYEPTYQKKLKDDIQNSIELDKTILIDSLSPNSTRPCFKYLRSFSPYHLPNEMHWKHRS